MIKVVLNADLLVDLVPPSDGAVVIRAEEALMIPRMLRRMQPVV